MLPSSRNLYNFWMSGGFPKRDPQGGVLASRLRHLSWSIRIANWAIAPWMIAMENGMEWIGWNMGIGRTIGFPMGWKSQFSSGFYGISTSEWIESIDSGRLVWKRLFPSPFIIIFPCFAHRNHHSKLPRPENGTGQHVAWTQAVWWDIEKLLCLIGKIN